MNSVNVYCVSLMNELSITCWKKKKSLYFFTGLLTTFNGLAAYFMHRQNHSSFRQEAWLTHATTSP